MGGGLRSIPTIHLTENQRQALLKLRATYLDAEDKKAKGIHGQKGCYYTDKTGFTKDPKKVCDGKIQPEIWNKYMKGTQSARGENIPESLLKIDKPITTSQAIKMLNEIDKKGGGI